MSPASSRRLLVVAAAVTAVAAALPASAKAPARSTTASYNGASAVTAPDSYASVFLTDTPGTLTGFDLTAKDDSRLRVRVADASGRPVAVRVFWDQPDGTSDSRYFCDATDVKTSTLPSGTDVYVEVVAGVCQDGSATPTLSAPTQGTVTFDFTA